MSYLRPAARTTTVMRSAAFIIVLTVIMLSIAAPAAGALLVPRLCYYDCVRWKKHEPRVLHCSRSLSSSSANDDFENEHDDSNRSDGDDDDMSRMMEYSSSELARRIESLAAAEARQAAAFTDGLRRRVRDVAAADAAASELLRSGAATDYDDADADDTVQCSSSSSGKKGRLTCLPVVAWDVPLLPCQRFSGMTTDPTFSSLLRDLGLGGLLVLTSVNQKQRMVRRTGVLARIESVDVDRRDESNNDKHEEMTTTTTTTPPTAVRFTVSGKRPCRLVGPARDMVARIGRFRKCYDPNGEELALGWGEEKFTDSVFGGAIIFKDNRKRETTTAPAVLQCTEWQGTEVCCLNLDDDDETLMVNDGLVARAANILSLLDRWLTLASDPTTYRNLDVVASPRLRPGGGVDPSRLLQAVLKELGPRPPPTKPTAVAFWGAALITTPLLSVSAPEIRGAVLEAASADRCLNALERGLARSIQNLEGTKPLCP